MMTIKERLEAINTEYKKAVLNKDWTIMKELLKEETALREKINYELYWKK